MRAAKKSLFAILLLTTALGTMVGGVAGGVAEQVRAATNVDGVSSFQGCALGSLAPIDVLIMMDQTQSLRSTDPSNLRIVGLKAALRSMASEHETNGNVTYRVQMVGFGSRVVHSGSGSGLQGWTPVTSDSLSGLYQSTDRFSMPASGDIGVVTDFSAALRFADETLVASPATCRAVLWFTDGALDLSNNGQTFPATHLEKAAMGDICRPGGLSASLASDNIWNFAVGLTNKTGEKGASALASIVGGGSGNYLYSGECGQSLGGQSNGGTRGDFFRSPNSASLIFQMQGLVCTGRSCEPQALQPCVQGQFCPSNHQFPFWAGPGVASFTFDGLVRFTNGSAHPVFQITDEQSNESIIVSMRAGKASCSLANGLTTACLLDGIRISASSLAANEIRIVGRVPSNASGHALRAVFLLPSSISGSVQYTFFLKSSIDLSFVPKATGTPECPATKGMTAFIGCTLDGYIELVDAVSHSRINSGSVTLRNVHATLVSNKQDVIPVNISVSSGESIPFAINVPNSATIGVRYLQATGVLDLSQNGVLQTSIDVSLQQPLSLIPAPGFPVVQAPSTSMLTNVGDRFTIPIRVTGSARGDGGCVALGSRQPILSAPQGTVVKHLRTDIPTSCETIGVGRTVTYHIFGLISKARNGNLTAALHLRLGSGDDRSNFETPTVLAVVQANVPVNLGGSALLLTFLLIIATLGILAMSLLVNVITGRFAPRNLILSKTIEVAYSKEGLKATDGSPIYFGDFLSEHKVDASGERRREFQLSNGSVKLRFVAANLRQPKSWVQGLFRGPIASVSAVPTTLITGGAALKVHGPSKASCLVPQDLNEFWIFVVKSVAGKYEKGVSLAVGQEVFLVTGSLTIFIRSGGGSAAVERVVATVAGQLDGVASEFQADQATMVSKDVFIPNSVTSSSGSSTTPDDDSSYSI